MYVVTGNVRGRNFHEFCRFLPMNYFSYEILACHTDLYDWISILWKFSPQNAYFLHINGSFLPQKFLAVCIIWWLCAYAICVCYIGFCLGITTLTTVSPPSHGQLPIIGTIVGSLFGVLLLSIIIVIMVIIILFLKGRWKGTAYASSKNFHQKFVLVYSLTLCIHLQKV